MTRNKAIMSNIYRAEVRKIEKQSLMKNLINDFDVSME